MLHHERFKLFSNAALQWMIPLFVAIFVLFWSGWNNSTGKTDELTQRVAALEAHQTDDSGKLDHIQEQVDAIYKWAMGK